MFSSERPQRSAAFVFSLFLPKLVLSMQKHHGDVHVTSEEVGTLFNVRREDGGRRLSGVNLSLEPLNSLGKGSECNGNRSSGNKSSA